MRLSNSIGFIFFYLFLGVALFAQKDNPVFIEIAGEEITKEAFKEIYLKNNSGELVQKSSVDEYLDLFINFKLKVKEAEEKGYDTVSSFKKELAGYRKQLAQPYLTEQSMLEQLKKEAYERLKEDVRVRHILIAVDQDAAPEDTLKAYQKALSVKKRIQEGDDFAAVAKEVSDDPSAKTNGGDLGYFTAFYMVYPFETEAYESKVGGLSDIVRSRFGYHLIKVIDRRPAVGTMTAAHILISKDAQLAKTDDPEGKIREIYQELQEGADFKKMAQQHSDDHKTAVHGGMLPPFGVGKMVPEFEEVAFGLKKDGDYSEPFETAYGWHIVKRVKHRPIGSYEEMSALIQNKMDNDSRTKLTEGALVQKIKKQYGFKQKRKNIEDFYELLDSTYFTKKWDESKLKGKSKFLFKIGEQEYTQSDFADFLNRTQRKRNPFNVKNLVNERYNRFVKSAIIDYKDRRLDEEYPEFKALMQEYRDGILLFNITEKQIWKKASEDSAGLAQFYKKNKENYKWGKRLDAIYFSAGNRQIAEKAISMLEEGIEYKKVIEEINRSSQLNLKYERSKFEKGDHPIVDQVEWKSGISNLIENGGRIDFVYVKQVLEPTYKTLEDSKGMITSDYQDYLEKKWIEMLRNKYEYSVNQAVLKQLKKELE